ncbi:MAG: hypothetical protein KGK10_09170 [Rhodospirillales bacterium]|nr:hypothetical protein [Rhodospirillales bacterium]
MSAAGPRSDPLDALEPDQRSSVAERPLPRRKLGRGITWLLVGLRLYVLVAIPIVVYAFVHALTGG